MPAKSRRVYFDACVILAYVGNEEGRADVVQALLDEARRGDLEILTSVVSIAEVAFGAHERDAGLTPDGEAAIDEMWTPKSPITLVDISEALARGARSIIRDARANQAGGVRSVDALHLASARLHACDAVFTYEDAGQRGRWQQLCGIEVTEPVTNTPQLGPT